MKKELIGFFICTVLVVTAVFSASGNSFNEQTMLNEQIIQIKENSTDKGDGVDWWPMYHHDLQLTGYTTSTAPDTNKVLWAHGTFYNYWYSP